MNLSDILNNDNMNLDDMLSFDKPKVASLDELYDGDGIPKEASLMDLTWLDDGLLKPGAGKTFDPTGPIGTQDHDIKPALEHQWGYHHIDPIFSEQDKLEPTSAPSSSSVPLEIEKWLRDQMNMGVQGKALNAKLNAKFTKENIKEAKDVIASMQPLQGVVGCFAIDGRGYKSCKVAMELAKKSPFKRYIKYVIGCNCGTPHKIEHNSLQKLVSASDVETSSIDSFINDNTVHATTYTDHCASTALNILANDDGINDDDVDKDVTDLQELGGLTASDVSKVKSLKASNIERLRHAFMLVIIRRQTPAAVDGGNSAQDVKDYTMETAPHNIDLNPEFKNQHVNIEDRLDQNIEPIAPFIPQEVELSQFLDPEFEGTDNIELNNQKAPESPLDIDGRSNIDFGDDDER